MADYSTQGCPVPYLTLKPNPFTEQCSVTYAEYISPKYTVIQIIQGISSGLPVIIAFLSLISLSKSLLSTPNRSVKFRGKLRKFCRLAHEDFQLSVHLRIFLNQFISLVWTMDPNFYNGLLTRNTYNLFRVLTVTTFFSVCMSISFVFINICLTFTGMEMTRFPIIRFLTQCFIVLIFLANFLISDLLLDVPWWLYNVIFYILSSILGVISFFTFIFSGIRLILFSRQSHRDSNAISEKHPYRKLSILVTISILISTAVIAIPFLLAAQYFNNRTGLGPWDTHPQIATSIPTLLIEQALVLFNSVIFSTWLIIFKPNWTSICSSTRTQDEQMNAQRQRPSLASCATENIDAISKEGHSI